MKKFRLLAVAGTVAFLAALPMGAAHAAAEPICQTVVVSGVVYEPFHSCVPYSNDVQCVPVNVGPPSTLNVTGRFCVPTILVVTG